MKKTTNKNNNGRKKLDESIKKRTISFTISPENIIWIKKNVKRSKSLFIDRLITDFRNNKQQIAIDI
jgi:hypothetical protein